MLVTGATGYIGGRLVPRLLAAGYRARVFVRSPLKLIDVPWANEVEITTGNLGDAESGANALEGIDVLYYLVHSMGAKGEFEQIGHASATTVAHAAKAAGVSRIVYLAGLHPDGELPPPPLPGRSRSHPARLRGADGCAPGGCGDRFGVDLVRDGAAPHRRASLYVGAPLGAQLHPADQVWRVIEGIGGDNGWYSFPLAWAVRGWMDKLVGGAGLRRGRRNAAHLNAGDALDFWRVEELDRGGFLRLHAEMKVPGGARLELSVTPDESGRGSNDRQRAVFFPRGLGGRLYWCSVLPFHGVIFAGMARKITQAAEAQTLADGRVVG